MNLNEFQYEIQRKLPDMKLSFQEPLACHTSFKIGGPATVMAFPTSKCELALLLKAAHNWNVPFAILGAGTNILAPDEGIDALVICLKNTLNDMIVLGQDRICVDAGVTMTRAAVFAANLGLSGLEFAHGIPGTVGGGVYMNAGAYGSDISNVCVSAEVMDLQGRTCILSADELSFSYRHSALENQGKIIVNAVFQLNASRPEKIKLRMKELMDKRSASQPLDMPSAGSAFKRPKGGYAAALIEQAGLKGYAVGGASVSVKHAGFIVNTGNATASDVRQLLKDVTHRVFDNSGIHLEPEIRIW